ncbi:MAG: hypothetical protein INQ03_18190 [Candidatus Heimdallarchaeota archaeon]|nr:hypothetical protein [Candidatus Heimdallarchaeota archaeon]
MSIHQYGIQAGESLELSENEKLVLHSLVKWPNLSDQQIHSRIKMKKSTFSSIKTRLRERQMFTKIYIPNFSKLGFELLHVQFGNLNRFTTYEERMRIAGEMMKSFKEDFFVVSESNKALNLSISKNYTEFAKNIEKFYQVYSENNFLSKEGLKIISFPFETTRIRSFLDFEPLMNKLFDLKAEETDPHRCQEPSGKVVKLTKAETKVLIGLIKYAEESDTFIAEKINVSRNTVASSKRKFVKEKILYPKIIPNLPLLGFKILALTYRRFNPEVSMKDREDSVLLIKEKLSPHFYISNNLEGILISAHQSFEDYDKSNDEIMKFNLKHNYMKEEPQEFKFSIPDIKIIKHYDFLSVVLKFFNLKEIEFQ